jgi:hypothetical protein
MKKEFIRHNNESTTITLVGAVILFVVTREMSALLLGALALMGCADRNTFMRNHSLESNADTEPARKEGSKYEK